MTQQWILYGATGYTGRLIAAEAARRKLSPIMAGRSKESLQKLSGELQLDYRAFGLDDEQRLRESIRGTQLILNCAGPFSATARPLMKACLAARVHYLDITGELDVIEVAAQLNQQAQQAGVVLLPAVGFDVVPSDCLAASLAKKFPTATKLTLAFSGLNALSPGTAKTMVEAFAHGGRVRKQGRIEKVPLAWKTHEIPFRDGKHYAMTIPWGDVASAFYSTGIGDIEVYAAAPLKQIEQLRRWRWLFGLLKFSPLRRAVVWLIEKKMIGPSSELRERETASFWGRVENEQGDHLEATLTTPNGYSLTVLTTLAIVERMLAAAPPAGFNTPAQAFGADYILEFPDCEMQMGEIKR